MGAKLLIEVQAGIIPGQPEKEFTRVWSWSSEDQDALIGGDAAAKQRYIDMAGASREYAASLENPVRLNWVRRDWVWM